MDVFDLAAKITLDSSGFEKSLSAVGGSLKTIAGVSTAAMGSAVAGVTALAKQSVDSYASYEQLVGGVDTLFKDSTLKVQQYAENAYKTAGLSANEYMETVTSFSASLLQSLEGDTERAADVADVAIRDMSDNANKMGTSMESIQNAYQGFAKQNYTMLDNLKLGYGGTKAEMERLLTDANELNEKQGIYTDYQIENYADIVEAIHVVQSEMGITGTTASEAAATIEGSMSSLQASWSNLLTELGKGGDVNKALENSGVEWGKYADKAWAASGAVEGVVDEIQYNLERINKGEGSLEELQDYLHFEYDMDTSDAVTAIEAVKNSMSNSQGVIDNFVQSLEAAAENIIPRIVTVLGGIGDAIEHVAPIIAEEVPKLAQEVLPTLISAASGLVSSFADAVRSALPTLINAIVEALPDVIDAIKDLASNLLPAIAEAIGIIADGLPGIVHTLGKSLSGLAPILVGALRDVIVNVVDGITNTAPVLLDAVLGIVTSLGDAIIESWPTILTALYKLIPAVINFITDGIPKVLEVAEHLITKAVTELMPEVIAVATEQLPAIITAITQLVPKIEAAIAEILPRLIETIITSVPMLITALTDSLPVVIEAVITALSEMYPAVHEAITTLITSLLDLMPLYQEMIYKVIPQLLEVLVKLIVEFTPELIDLSIGVFTSMINMLVKIVPSLLKNLFTVIKTAVVTGFNIIVEAGKEIGEHLPDIIDAVVDWVKELPGRVVEWLSTLPERIGSVLSVVIPVIVDWSTKMSTKAREAAQSMLKNVVEWLSGLPERVGYFLANTIANIIKWAIEAPGKMREAARTMLENVIEFISKLPERVRYFITEVLPKIQEWAADLREKGRQAALDFFNVVVNKIKELPGQMLDIGTNIVTGIWNGIQSAKDWLTRQIGSFASGVVSGFKDAFEISSPSKVMRDSVGKFLADGIGVGFVDEMDTVIDDMTKAVNVDSFGDVDATLGASVTPLGVSAATGGITLNVINNWDGTQIHSDMDLAEIIEEMTDKAIIALSEKLEQRKIFDTRAYGGVVAP